jgi:uncharacterized membrane protein
MIMPALPRLSAAALAGLASSMRSTSGPALLAARGRFAGPRRVTVLLAAVGELIGDKLPAAMNRTAPPAVAGRVAAGAYTGAVIGGAAGSAIAAVSAGAGTFATYRARAWMVDRTGLPDPVVAVAEDVLALTAAAVATRPGPSSPLSR